MAKKLRSFDEVIGHTSLMRFLRKQVAEDSVGNVIIFHGSPGIGKSSIAKLLAIEVVCRYADNETRERFTKAVIDDNQSTDCIRLFNMSEVQEKDEEIQKVKMDLSVGFASMGRKVLILDEAHNIRAKAQDAILTELEHLPKNVYVFICTTEISALRDALKSRSKATFRLNGLSTPEAKRVLQGVVREKNLSFDIAQNVVEALVCEWANNQPRQICNLFDNFPDGSLVMSRDLEVFINVSTAASIIELLKYLYGSMMLGIEYLNGMKFDESFASMLVEVCKVALGEKSNSVSREDSLYIRDFIRGKEPMHILRFTAEVTGLSDLRKRKVISAFMKSHVDYERVINSGIADNLSRAEDLRVLAETVQEQGVNSVIDNDIKVPSLDELFSISDRIV